MRKGRAYLYFLLALTLHVIIIETKTLNRIAYNKKPTSDPFKVIEVEEFPNQRCFSSCHYQLKCMSLLIEKLIDGTFRCSLYDRTIRYMSLIASDAVEAVFHSIVVQVFNDCVDWYNVGARTTGVYEITLSNGESKKVRCNMQIDGGGWLVFQHRFNGGVDFNNDWDEYKNGFGSVDGEHWLGNQYLNLITTVTKHELYLHAGRFNNGGRKYSKFDYFEIENENLKYRLKSGANRVGGIESMSENFGMNFTTNDQDNDKFTGHCSLPFKRGGFWYNACASILFNGVYYKTEVSDPYWGLNWRNHWLSSTQSLQWTEMMIRRVNRDP
ncbi:angiopoietin-2-like [Clytia hemisphaerica]|uniref:Fibrinogen C-terminal domain-containing protein n=1 Tax=Clytia hemisphaerica TaxID=252671 RepID=A0A7M5V314_9CNID